MISEKRKEYLKKYRETHREQMREAQRKYRLAHPEVFRESSRKYREKNKRNCQIRF